MRLTCQVLPGDFVVRVEWMAEAQQVIFFLNDTAVLTVKGDFATWHPAVSSGGGGSCWEIVGERSAAEQWGTGPGHV